MKNSGRVTYGQLYDEHVRQNVPKPKKPPTYEEMRINFYQFKLLDIFWFEGSISSQPDSELIYYANDDWPNPSVHLFDTSAVNQLNEGELVFLCERLKKPSWVKRTRRSRASMRQFAERWKLFK